MRSGAAGVVGAAALAGLVAAGCGDRSPTGPGRSERVGVLRLGAPRVAVLLTFTPGDGIDSVVAGSGGGLATSGVRDGRVLLFHPEGLPTTLRLRVFGRGAGASTATVTAVADSAGGVEEGPGAAGTAVVWER